MNDPNKQRLADALAAMTGGTPQAPPVPAAPPISGGPQGRGSPAPSASPSAAATPEMSDDDSAVAPPPDPTKLGRHLTVGTTVFESSLRLKRTLIPVLLTLGVLLPVTASLKWITPRDSAFASWSTGLAIALMFVGLCLLAAAVFNMLHVRDMLSRAARDSLTHRRTNS